MNNKNTLRIPSGLRLYTYGAIWTSRLRDPLCTWATSILTISSARGASKSHPPDMIKNKICCKDNSKNINKKLNKIEKYKNSSNSDTKRIINTVDKFYDQLIRILILKLFYP